MSLTLALTAETGHPLRTSCRLSPLHIAYHRRSVPTLLPPNVRSPPWIVWLLNRTAAIKLHRATFLKTLSFRRSILSCLSLKRPSSNPPLPPHIASNLIHRMGSSTASRRNHLQEKTSIILVQGGKIWNELNSKDPVYGFKNNPRLDPSSKLSHGS